MTGRASDAEAEYLGGEGFAAVVDRRYVEVAYRPLRQVAQRDACPLYGDRLAPAEAVLAQVEAVGRCRIADETGPVGG